jgi:hypothetical protein
LDIEPGSRRHKAYPFGSAGAETIAHDLDPYFLICLEFNLQDMP